jgi:fatty-acyl-CoA synthase
MLASKCGPPGQKLLYKHPAVLEACVIGVPDDRRGETVKALVVLREGYRDRITPQELIEWAKGEMAAYKYPREIEFVGGLPHSGTGKVQWRLLQDQERRKPRDV